MLEILNNGAGAFRKTGFHFSRSCSLSGRIPPPFEVARESRVNGTGSRGASEFEARRAARRYAREQHREVRCPRDNLSGGLARPRKLLRRDLVMSG